MNIVQTYQVNFSLCVHIKNLYCLGATSTMLFPNLYKWRDIVMVIHPWEAIAIDNEEISRMPNNHVILLLPDVWY